MSKPRYEDVAQGSSCAPELGLPWEKVLTVMLQGDYLTAAERLAWFKISKGAAEAVLRHVPCTHVTHTFEPPAVATGGSNSKPRLLQLGQRGMQTLLRLLQLRQKGGQTCSTSAQAATAQRLAAVSHNVTLALDGGLHMPDACLWQPITTLQLQDIQLDEFARWQLQLQKLPRLHSLSLRQCRMAPSSSNNSNVMQQHRSTSVRTLTCTNRVPGSYNFTPVPFPTASLHWVDPLQLVTLIVDHDPSSITTLLPQLPALQELRISSQPKPHCCDVWVTDDDMQRLLAHPRLARVSLPALRLQRSHADTSCTWESLNLLEGVDLAEMGRMPLAGIQSCTVHGMCHVPQETEAAMSNISRAQKLVFQAGHNDTACKWTRTPAEPSFMVDFGWYRHETRGLSAKAISLVLRNLSPGTSALVLKKLKEVQSPEVLASLAAAPPTLTTLCFSDFPVHHEAMQGEAGMDAGVLTHVPAHVNHVVLELTDVNELRSWLRSLEIFVTGVQRPLRLTLLFYKYMYSSGYRHDDWLPQKQRVVRDWVASRASQHVHAQFQSFMWGPENSYSNMIVQ